MDLITWSHCSVLVSGHVTCMVQFNVMCSGGGAVCTFSYKNVTFSFINLCRYFIRVIDTPAIDQQGLSRLSTVGFLRTYSVVVYYFKPTGGGTVCFKNTRLRTCMLGLNSLSRTCWMALFFLFDNFWPCENMLTVNDASSDIQELWETVTHMQVTKKHSHCQMEKLQSKKNKKIKKK